MDLLHIPKPIDSIISLLLSLSSLLLVKYFIRYCMLPELLWKQTLRLPATRQRAGVLVAGVRCAVCCGEVSLSGQKVLLGHVQQAGAGPVRNDIHPECSAPPEVHVALFDGVLGGEVVMPGHVPLFDAMRCAQPVVWSWPRYFTISRSGLPHRRDAVPSDTAGVAFLHWSGFRIKRSSSLLVGCRTQSPHEV